MKFVRRLLFRLRRRRGNQRVSRQASRAILGSISLSGTQRREPMRLWRVLLWPLLALLIFQIEAGLLGHVGAVARVDVAVLFISFFALHLGAIEGALAAYLVGYVADLFVQGPPGLCRFLAVATWTVVRVASARVSLPTWFSSLVYAGCAAAAYQAGVLGGLSLVAGEGNAPGTIAWLSVVPQAILTAVFAVPLHAALQRLDRLTTRGELAR